MLGWEAGQHGGRLGCRAVIRISGSGLRPKGIEQSPAGIFPIPLVALIASAAILKPYRLPLHRVTAELECPEYVEGQVCRPVGCE